MNPREYITLTGIASGLFVGAALAFGFGQFALGGWLAFGCTALCGLGLTASMRADHPATLDALADLKTAHEASWRALDARLVGLENKATFLTASFSSAFPARQSAPAGPMRSPVRPPIPRP